MSWTPPDKVIITGGRYVGGVGSFAEGLCSGLRELGVSAEVIAPSQLLSRIGELRSRRVLKILSTFGMLSVPFARRAIGIVHGVPLVPWRGWSKTVTDFICYKLTSYNPSARLVSVSDYIAAHMYSFYGIRVDAVVRNSIKPLFLEPCPDSEPRNYITYVGRLIPIKNVHRLLPAMRDVMNENSDLRACIIGNGPEEEYLRKMVENDARFEFRGDADDVTVRSYLRRTRVFVSGHPTEGFGITYAEALSQGCVLAMPASGGGIEIALSQVGNMVQLLPISLDHGQVVDVLRRAVKTTGCPVSMEDYSPRTIAAGYLDVDRRFYERQSYSANVTAGIERFQP